jgi:hypothetical protein
VPAVTEEALSKYSEISIPLFQGDRERKKFGKINVAGKASRVRNTITDKNFSTLAYKNNKHTKVS